MIVAAVFLAMMPMFALAHVSQQGFILLLPTKLYIVSGAATVAITTLVLALMAPDKIGGLFNFHQISAGTNLNLAKPASLASTALLLILILIGIMGPADPLKNLLPLVIWTLWWQGFLVLQGLVGNIWRWFNPWTGIYCIFRGNLRAPGWFKFPKVLGVSPAIVAFCSFSIFSLIDPAPDSPPRLAIIVSGYWLYTMMGMMLFGGKDWLAHCECFSILLRLFALISPFSVVGKKLRIGLPGWQLARLPAPKFSIAVLIIILLATGSFDGLNETFWWLGKIGINPLEFPGRSFCRPAQCDRIVICPAISTRLLCRADFHWSYFRGRIIGLHA